MVADLEQEVARVRTAHARLVRAAEGKLRDYGIPTEELGFLPQVVAAAGNNGAGGGRPGMESRMAGKEVPAARAGGSQRVMDVSISRATAKA